MCIPFREQLQAKDQRISTLEAQLAEAAATWCEGQKEGKARERD